jgi:NADPH-dependent 2,4-dienoyl-CoA reductase/sulfur reductase-like enzyme
MGAGLIGCEFANDLYNAGISVEIVDPLPYPLNRFLLEPAGRALERAGSAVQGKNTLTKQLPPWHRSLENVRVRR